MIYSIETIPAKIYLKILKEGNVRLLTEGEDVDEKDLNDIWNDIVEEYEKISRSNNKSEKILDLSKKIQRLSVKYEAIKNAVFLLKTRRDEELEDLLKSYGYKFSEERFKDDLKSIEVKSSTIQIRIDKFKQQLDKYNPENKPTKKETTFEQLLMGYLAVLGFGFRDANTITLLEFDGLEKQVFQKIKALENAGRNK